MTATNHDGHKVYHDGHNHDGHKVYHYGHSNENVKTNGILLIISRIHWEFTSYRIQKTGLSPSLFVPIMAVMVEPPTNLF